MDVAGEELIKEIESLRKTIEEKEREIRFWKAKADETRKEGEKFRMLFDGIGDAAYFRKDGGKFIEVNRAACERLGYAREELLNMGIEHILGDYSLTRHQEIVDEIKKNGSYTFLSNHRTKDGRILPTEVHSRLVHFDNYDAILSISRDITERIEAEKRFKQSEEKYRNLFENAIEGIFQSDAEGHILVANPALAKMYGYDSPEELISSVTDVERQLYVDPEDRKRLLAILKEKGFVSGYEVRRLRKDGTFIWVSLYIKATRDKDGSIKLYEGRVVDVTEKKRTEEALRESNKNLELQKANLEEANTTLKVLLKQMEDDKKEMEERFASNIMTLVLPYVEKIKKGNLDSIQRSYVDVLETNLNEILSPFLSRLSHIKLTPKEIQVSNLIREGKTIKEISKIAGVSIGTVITHRNNIRKKLNLKKKRINLQSFLQSIE